MVSGYLGSMWNCVQTAFLWRMIMGDLGLSANTWYMFSDSVELTGCTSHALEQGTTNSLYCVGPYSQSFAQPVLDKLLQYPAFRLIQRHQYFIGIVEVLWDVHIRLQHGVSPSVCLSLTVLLRRLMVMYRCIRNGIKLLFGHVIPIYVPCRAIQEQISILQPRQHSLRHRFKRCY